MKSIPILSACLTTAQSYLTRLRGAGLTQAESQTDIRPRGGRLERSILRRKGRGMSRRRRRIMVSSAIVSCLVLPLGVSEFTLYRQNLAVATESFPPMPPLRDTDRLLVLVPHCDDETLGVGSTIHAARARGIAVRVVFLTNGDGSRSTQIAEDVRRLRLNSFLELARLRQREATAALGELGVTPNEITFLGYPDGGTGLMWQRHWSAGTPYKSSYTGVDHSPYANSYTPNAAYCGTQVLRDVTSIMRSFRPTIVFTTHPSDTHPDHWAAYAYTRAAIESLRLRSDTQPWARDIQLLTFLVHRGLWPAPHGYHPNARLSPPAALVNTGTHWVQVPLEADARAAKKAALERYVSQTVFTPYYLRGFLRRNELFGIVPVATAESDRVHNTNFEQPALLLQDPARDSPLHDVWPSADIREVSLDEKANSDTLTVQVELTRPLSSRLSYQLSLHIVSDNATNAWLIKVRHRGSSLRAVAQPPVASGKVTAQLTPNGFVVKLPRRALQLAQEPCTLFISGSTFLGGSQLDQTETGTLRLMETPLTSRNLQGPIRVLTN
jgi:LmbE family N-acetylglucosaminyl deacetylase